MNPLRITQQQLLLILVIIANVASQCIVGTSPNGTTCSSHCKDCTNSMVCTDCCQLYYIDTSGLCTRCDDLNCQICSYDPIYNSTCTYCKYSYGLVSGTPGTCSSCTTSNAQQCSSINLCTFSGTCINCADQYVPINGMCAICEDIFPNCNRCNQNRCLNCAAGYVVNQ